MKLDGGKDIAVFDTEAGSASLYAGRFTFLTDQIEPPFTPEKIVAALREAEMAGGRVVILTASATPGGRGRHPRHIVNTATVVLR